MKTIVVCGDLVWDTHIARLASDPRGCFQGYFQPHEQSQMENRRGGAWYLGEMIQQAIGSAQREAHARLQAQRQKLSLAQAQNRSSEALPDMTRRVEEAEAWLARFQAEVKAPQEVDHLSIEEGGANAGGVARGFSVWEWFDAVEKPARAKAAGNGEVTYAWKQGESLPGAWRVKEFLGCQAARWPQKEEESLSGSAAVAAAASNGDPAASKREPISCPGILGLAGVPCLAVIDDLGLGFADHEACWPKILFDERVPVLVKATPPFDRDLWKRLLVRNGPPRLTVVVSATALRDAGAHLSRGFSWDKTIQEVRDEFAPGGTCWPLRTCGCVVVSFGQSGAAVFSRTPRSPAEAKAPSAQLQYERFVYDPEHLEETWSHDLPGITFGTTSVITAAMAVHRLAEPQPSSHLAVSRGLAAARTLHRLGGGHDPRQFDIRAADAAAFEIDSGNTPERAFRSAFPRDLLDAPVLGNISALPSIEEQTLLTDALGTSPAFLAVAAQDIVRFGKERPLRSVPRLKIGDYFTVDREEIERLNMVRNLILDYRRNEADKRPLSLAVLGPPGAGKGFAIEELCGSLLGKETAVLKFNLSQFEDLAALHEALHVVRDKSLEGKLPLVFWDEFDTRRAGDALGWLKEFLAPMQDAKFVANGRDHPIGKCIFIFAGGTCATFDEFIRPMSFEDRPHDPGAIGKEEDRLSQEARHFKLVKGTDFVSRLRGYVNIKGPNPASCRSDPVYIIRRALMLRLLIERHHKQMIHPVTKELVISPAVLDAFLRVGNGDNGKGYLHGARSMEAIVSLSRLGGSRHFGPSELPGREVLELHVTSDFLGKVLDKSTYRFSPDDIEKLAEKKHLLWLNEKKDEKNDKNLRYVYGPDRDDHANPPTHPLLKPYAQLEEKDKENNRLPARLAQIRLAALGYHFCLADHVTGQIVADDRLPLEILAQAEHRRWMRQKLLEGIAWSPRTNDGLLLHQDICRYAQLTPGESRLDKQIIEAIRSFMVDKMLVLVAAAPEIQPPQPWGGAPKGQESSDRS